MLRRSNTKSGARAQMPNMDSDQRLNIASDVSVATIWDGILQPPEWRPCDSIQIRTVADLMNGKKVETARGAIQADDVQNYKHQSRRYSRNSNDAVDHSQTADAYGLNKSTYLSSQTLPNTSAVSCSTSDNKEMKMILEWIERLATKKACMDKKATMRSGIEVRNAPSDDSSSQAISHNSDASTPTDRSG